MLRNPMERVHTIRLEGLLTGQQLRSALEGVEPSLNESGAHGLIVDALQMHGYERDARDLFVQWNARHRERITRVAIVTRKTVWRVVIAGMSLASRQDMRAFEHYVDAKAWLRDAS